MEKLDLLKLSKIDKERIKKLLSANMLQKNFSLPPTVFMSTVMKQNSAFVRIVTHFFLPIKNIWLAISEAILTVMGHENELRKQLSIHGSRKKPKFRFLSPKSINIEKKSLTPCVLVPNQFRISTLEAQICFLMQLKVRYIKIHNFNFSKYF